MKKILIVLVIASSMFSYAQKGSNEASFDVLDGIVMKSIEFSYERYIMDQSSIGLSMLFNLKDPENKLPYYEKNMFTPYFRHYLVNDTKFDYFGELFLGINKPFNAPTDLAIGASGGVKYLSDGGIFLSALVGLGRNLVQENSKLLVPRAGINLGYRF